MPQILDKKDDFPLFHLIPSLATVHPKEKKRSESIPRAGELPLAWRQELARHGKTLAGNVSPVSPTFKPSSGRWM